MRRLRNALLAVVASASIALGAVAFDGTSNGTGAGTGSAWSTPYSICGWTYIPAATESGAYLIGITNASSGTDYIFARRVGVTGGAQALSRDSGGTATATTSTTGAGDVWHHICATFGGTAERTAYLDAGGKVGDVTNRTPSNPTALSLGFLNRNPPDNYSVVTLAEVGYWNVELEDTDVALLASGYAPPCVKRANLVAYFQMAAKPGATVPNTFVKSPAPIAVTLGSGTASAAHPRIVNCQ